MPANKFDDDFDDLRFLTMEKVCELLNLSRNHIYRLEKAGKTIKPEHEHDHGGHVHTHTHDETVTSVGIEEPRELDPKKLNNWLSELLQSKGADIFRMKGILNLKGSPSRFVFQGVHMMFEGKADRPWKDASERKSQLVFIGRDLDREALNAGFRRCLA